MADLETWNVPWSPQEDEAFAEKLARPFPLGHPSPTAPGHSSLGPGATGDELEEAA
jgi:hypothetical protein